jgi:glycerol-1-phosphate dehydrogenase [NAD(P)+]
MEDRIAAVLRCVSDTRVLRLGNGVITETPEVFRSCFGEQAAVVVADVNTFKAAGKRVGDVVGGAGLETLEPVVFDNPDLHAHYRHVEDLVRTFQKREGIPIAVGSGTVNDLVKLAAHECQRPYMVVGTAASMDGYTSYGASITRDGAKTTFFCPAPKAVVADLDIISAAPAELNAAGYGDLIAKVPAGADWMLADVMGTEPIHPEAWSSVQDHLREWVANPHAVRSGDHAAIRNLTEGLLMTGFAMQWARSSRPASGAEHLFSHLWDMQNHHHNGQVPLHGCKVAIGSMATTLLYDLVLDSPIEKLNIDRILANWPSEEELDDRIRCTQRLESARAVALVELKAKYIDHQKLKARLKNLQAIWPSLRERLRRQLLPADELRQMLAAAGTPYDPAQIGIDLDRLQQTYWQAQQMRRRYTVLDLAVETGQMSACLNRLFAPDGPWRMAVK